MAVTMMLTGCHANMLAVPTRVSGSGRASPGIVKYYNDGTESTLATAREDAFKQIREACGGAYRIVREEPRDEEGAIVALGSVGLQTYNEFVYIEYVCKDTAGANGH